MKCDWKKTDGPGANSNRLKRDERKCKEFVSVGYVIVSHFLFAHNTERKLSNFAMSTTTTSFISMNINAYGVKKFCKLKTKTVMIILDI